MSVQHEPPFLKHHQRPAAAVASWRLITAASKTPLRTPKTPPMPLLPHHRRHHRALRNLTTVIRPPPPHVCCHHHESCWLPLATPLQCSPRACHHHSPKIMALHHHYHHHSYRNVSHKQIKQVNQLLPPWAPPRRHSAAANSSGGHGFISS